MIFFNYFKKKRTFNNFKEFIFYLEELEAEQHKIYLLMNNKFSKELYFETQEKNQKVYDELIQSFIGVLNKKFVDIDGFETEELKNKEIEEVVNLKTEIHDYIISQRDVKIKLDSAKSETIKFEKKLITKYNTLKEKSKSHPLQDLFLTLSEAHTNQVELIEEIEDKKKKRK
jgi:hypothetical protein